MQRVAQADTVEGSNLLTPISKQKDFLCCQLARNTPTPFHCISGAAASRGLPKTFSQIDKRDVIFQSPKWFNLVQF